MRSLVFASRIDQRRLRVRTIEEHEVEEMACEVADQAVASGRWAHDADHGGSVRPSYNYPSRTTTALVVSDPEGNAVAWMNEISANSATLAGAAASNVPSARPLYDDRYSDERVLAEAEAALRRAHAEAWIAAKGAEVEVEAGLVSA